MDSSHESQFWIEYHNAQASISDGLEGRARVCARRAASILIRDYLKRKNNLELGLNSLETIQYMQERSEQPELTSLLSHFTEKVNMDHHLPSKTNLISSLFQLARILDISLTQQEK